MLGEFICLGFFVAFVAACIVFGMRAKEKKRPVEIPLDEVPELVLAEATRRVIGLKIERVMQRPRGGSYRVYGYAGGQPIRIKVRLANTAQPYVEKIEIQPETRSSHRSLKGKHLVEPSTVPDVVIKQAHRFAESVGAPLQEISRIKAATVQGLNAYDIKGWSGDWRVEVELLDDGELLELELEYRPSRQRVR